MLSPASQARTDFCASQAKTTFMETSAGQQTILVTGAAGLLGSRVVPLLSHNVPDCRIIAVSRRESYVSHDPRVEVIYGDLRDEQLWTRLPDNITKVIHLAAMIPWRQEQKSQSSVVQDNLQPITNLIEYSQRWPKLQQVIYSSSISVYEQTNELLNEQSPTRPDSLYGVAKLRGEDLLHCLNVKGVAIVSLRFSSLYARGQYEGTVLPIMVRRAQQGQDILIFGDGMRTQDFLHCEDAANAVLLTLKSTTRGIYNIGSGTSTTMTELAEKISSVFSDGKAKIVYQPERADGNAGIRLDVSKARDELNYQPQISLECGLRKLKQEMES
jgi:UDP-glucose 4-epimerase